MCDLVSKHPAVNHLFPILFGHPDRSLAPSVGDVLSPSAIHVHIYWIPGLWDQSFSHQRSITNGNIRMAL